MTEREVVSVKQTVDGSCIAQRLPANESLAVIGEIALKHAWLDNQLCMMIKDFSGADQKDVLQATKRESSRELRDRARTLAKKKFGEGALLILIQSLLHQCELVSQKRNDLLHSAWGETLDEGLPAYRNDIGDFVGAPSKSELQAVAQELTALLHEIIDQRKNGAIAEALET